MFTGLIQEKGIVTAIKPLANGCDVEIHCKTLLKELKLGDSISVNGVCSTVTSLGDTSFKVQYLPETLAKTTFDGITPDTVVNLELCLRPSDRIGGHFVSGHVDTVGQINALENKDPWGVLTVTYPAQFGVYLVPKGSVCIDGISLTVVDVHPERFTCHLIPHTISHTNLSAKKTGDRVNLEFDILGKYLYKFYQESNQSGQSESIAAALKDAGFIENE